MLKNKLRQLLLQVVVCNSDPLDYDSIYKLICAFSWSCCVWDSDSLWYPFQLEAIEKLDMTKQTRMDQLYQILFVKLITKDKMVEFSIE